MAQIELNFFFFFLNGIYILYYILEKNCAVIILQREAPVHLDVRKKIAPISAKIRNFELARISRKGN